MQVSQLVSGAVSRVKRSGPGSQTLALALALASAAAGSIIAGILEVADLSPVLVFSVAGALLLASGLTAARGVLVQRFARLGGGFTRTVLIARAAGRHPARSLAVIGLVASAVFVVVTVAANRSGEGAYQTQEKGSASGGFSLVVRTALPVQADLSTGKGQTALGFSPASVSALRKAKIVALREAPGEDASCLNLNQPKTPRLLGVPLQEWQREGRFDIVSEGAVAKEEKQGTGQAGAPLSAVADAASAQWILKKSVGDSLTAAGRGGRSLPLRLTGLMRGSLFASELLVAESAFVKEFGSDYGYQRFLIACEAADVPSVRQVLLRELESFGPEAETTAALLSRYARVQNTYLHAFASLGGLGLVLGTLGVVALLLRNVLERRGEMALLSAVGFDRHALVQLVLLENSALLACGMILGSVSALLAVLPRITSVGADIAWGTIACVMVLTVGTGAIGSWIAARWSLGGDLLEGLRSE